MTESAPRGPDELLDANVQTIGELRARTHERTHTRLHRPIERVFRLLARPATLYTLILLIVLWVVFNLEPHSPDPPPYSFLQGLLTALSLLTTLAVLSIQTREGELARERAELELQINLLAEQKVAKLIALVEELRRDLPEVPDREDREAQVMQQGADPALVLDALERREEQSD